MTASINGTTGITFPDATTQNTSPYTGGLAFRNRIINGSMTIDQRNAGASVTPANGAYTLDRYFALISQASKFTVQQNAGAVTPPAGFVNYLGCTSSSAYTVGSSEYFIMYQYIEGLNVADFGWGTANAQPVTLSFKVYSSLTGTFGGSLLNDANNRSYPFSYTVSSANTWTTASVTIPGDTSGTWLTNNGVGIKVGFSLGAGTTVSGTAGAWAAGNYKSATGATSVVGTNGATFYITGVQLEKGSTATSFDYRPYGTELALCQRYAFLIRGNAEYNGSGYARYVMFGNGTNQAIWLPQFPVQMRTTPSLVTSSSFVPNVNLYNYSTGSAPTLSSVSLEEGDVWHQQATFLCSNNIASGNLVSWRWSGQPNDYIGFTAEL